MVLEPSCRRIHYSAIPEAQRPVTALNKRSSIVALERATDSVGAAKGDHAKVSTMKNRHKKIR